MHGLSCCPQPYHVATTNMALTAAHTPLSLYSVRSIPRECDMTAWQHTTAVRAILVLAVPLFGTVGPIRPPTMELHIAVASSRAPHGSRLTGHAATPYAAAIRLPARLNVTRVGSVCWVACTIHVELDLGVDAACAGQVFLGLLSSLTFDRVHLNTGHRSTVQVCSSRIILA